MTAATIPSQARAGYDPGFTAQLSAEWTKLRSVRSFYIQVGLAIGLAFAMSGLISLAIGSSFDQLSAEEQATFDPVFTSFFGSIFGIIALIVMGVTFSSSEYTSGMIRLTMTATPQRGRVLAAKATLVLAVSWLVGVIIAFGCFLIGQAVLGSYEGVPSSSLSDGDALQAVIGAWLTTPLWPLLGVAIGMIMRSTASAITTTLVLLFVPAMFGGLLPDWWQRNILAYLPSNAGDSLLVTERDADSIYLEPVVAVVALVAWFVLAFGVAYALLRRRDV